MLRRLSKWSVVAALIFALGLHWPILQTIAWVTMTIDYSRTHTLADAIEKTFDGKNPCKVCRFVEDGRESEEKDSAPSQKTKLDLMLCLEPAPFSPPDEIEHKTAFLDEPFSRGQAPPLPPPRLG